MRQQEVTGLEPANDNPRPPGQGDLFGLRDIVIGPVAVGDPILTLSHHANGMAAIHEILEREDGPIESVA